MDPNQTLKNLRSLVEAVNAELDDSENLGPSRLASTDLVCCAHELAQHFEALDQWITSGGFLPEAWMTDYQITSRGYPPFGRNEK